MFEEILTRLDLLTKSELQNLLNLVQEKIDNLEFDEKQNFAGFIYKRIIDHLYSKFPARQVEWCSPWEKLKPTKKKTFTKSLLKAIEGFEKLGFDKNTKLFDMLINIVVRSPYYAEACTFDNLILSLDCILVLFENEFPEYVNNGGVAFLAHQMKNEVSK